MSSILSKIYLNRFSDNKNTSREIMWKTIYSYSLKKYIKPTDVVMDIGCGKCELLNTVVCKSKIGVDMNEDAKKHADKKIKLLNISAFKISNSFNGKIDVIVLSHFLEHLDSKDNVIRIVQRSHKLLRKGGRLIIFQPNIDLVKEAYWDFIDHKVALNTRSIRELMEINGFEIVEFIKRFLPYTTKGSLPVNSWLIRLYLVLPQFIRPFAGQTFVVGLKS